MFQRLSFAIAVAVVLGGCSSSSPGTLPASAPAGPAMVRSSVEIPSSFKCLPKIEQTNARIAHIAYASACSVAKAPESVALQKLAVGLMGFNGTSYLSYCTGTPIAYDAKTRIGFVVTAAHCVIGGAKGADTEITPANITTFARNYSELYQGTPTITTAASLTAKMMAVYVPSQYCKVPALALSGNHCDALDEQNGDIAVLKVQAGAHTALGVLPQLQLAPTHRAIGHGTLVMALGYGINTSATPNDRVLNYIDYEYFGDDLYEGIESEASIMNGYVHDQRYYSIICQGDSGGGDFYWDGTHWNLVGAHSWGPVPCGVNGGTYDDAFDVSADVRPFTNWIDKIVRHDLSATGCASLGAGYVCASRHT